jgi:hypothetical protein
VHFRKNFRDDGTVETYEKMCNRPLSSGAISEKWPKLNSKTFDEMVFDVDIDYFEQNGGYGFAEKICRVAYDLTVREIGGRCNGAK